MGSDRWHFRDVIWQLQNGIGLEYCRFELSGQSSLLGHVITTAEGLPCTIAYSIRCDEQWRTREVEFVVTTGDVELGSNQVYALQSDGNGRWYDGQIDDGVMIHEWSGCLDIDLGFSPATNTLPIRRFNLDVGQSADVTAAWVAFPSFEFRALPQRYTRIEPDRYLYESFESDFKAILDIDDLGLVTNYEGLWQLAAASDFRH